ncbi:amidohydrolase family protein [Marinitenerispora sediminis]|uniref:imidazolonepropionase n=1 Tax=Marinitenerispora sediminis TaxID=1931232 RepID=A0A368T5H1_9ACTN|nr:amidohydrolase family protein [Marinitenerispora sediminis]RCV50059.1 imidazolonepropionase [Marinitenerispora sediminis]RCV53995.1 imidazolonepropionase [Marinitenerispora sediminis]RCV58768.1 imidazolonepropionase [Marinitenerispora sediminis]
MTVRLLTNIGRLWTGTDLLSNAAMIVQHDRVAWVGPAAELPQSLPGVIDDIVDVDEVENLSGGLVTPGLIDAHTHPVYAGNRWAEIAMRASGASMAEVTAAGGGVASTVTVTRGTDPWTLCNGVRERLRHWLLSGTTTVEAKTGYHLTRDGELADVRLLRSLEEEPGMPRLHVTFFAAHAVPPEYFGRPRDYVDAVGSWLGDAAQAGADGVDVYCDSQQFTPDDARWLLSMGRSVGLQTRMHACAKPRHGAVRMAADIQCSSVDLLHETDEDDVLALAKSSTPVVVCPSSSLHERRTPPVRALLDHGVPVALGTDHNPAHSGSTVMSLAVCMAVAMFNMSVLEALRAATVGGAIALGATDRGVLAPGRYADMVQWDADHEGAFAWAYGLKALRVWRGGETIR